MRRLLTVIIAVSFSLAAFALVSCDEEERKYGGDTGPAVSPEDVGPAAGKFFYVSPDGDDGADGTEGQPLATLSGAAEAVRSYKSENGLPEGGIEVIFLPGVYRIDSVTKFSEEDSGADQCPIVYRASEKGAAVFDGGIEIDPGLFGHVSEDEGSVLSGEAREKVLVADLSAAGCYDTEDREYALGWQCYSYRQELYVDGKRQTPAKFPSDGYLSTVVYLDGDGVPYIELDEEKADAWSRGDPRLYGYISHDWDSVNLGTGAIEIDAVNNTLRITGTLHDSVPNASVVRLYVYNLLSELDSPGEYFWDTGCGKLYYYPDGGTSGKTFSFSQFAGDWITLEGTSYVSFRDLSFQSGRACVFTSGTSAADHVSIEGCLFRDLGGYAVRIKGTDITVRNCEFCELGSGCIDISGGDLNEVKASHSLITGNLFHDWSQTYTVYNPGIRLSGYGFTVSGNEMYNSPHEAIAFDCGGAVIEYNHIHDVCNQTSDAGAVYSGRRWDWSGNVIRYNLIENISDTMFGGTPNGIYLDDNISGQTCCGNILKNISGRCILVGGGRKNTIENNIFVCPTCEPVSWDGRGLGNEFMHDVVTYPDGYMWQKIRSTVDYLSEMQRFAVPENLIMIEHTGTSKMRRRDDPGTPAYGFIRDNIVIRAEDDRRDYFEEPLYWGTVEGNAVYSEDPGFYDQDSGDYSLRDDSRVRRDIPGFPDIDCANIGLR